MDLQTPDFVRMTMKGGSVATYRTEAFLSQCPENLSPSFRVLVVFGIDYDHQKISTSDVPIKMARGLSEALSAKLSDGDIHNLTVEFMAAGGSSLDYAAIVDFDGRVAADLDHLSRTIQRTLVDICNAEGWGIPFPQVTVHAKAGGAVPPLASAAATA